MLNGYSGIRTRNFGLCLPFLLVGQTMTRQSWTGSLDECPDPQLDNEFILKRSKMPWFWCRVFNNSELKGAPNMAKKRTKWSTNFFFSKEPYFWKKEHNFYPKTIFFYIFIHKFFWKCQNVAIFFGFYRWFLVFFKKFSKKVYFTVLQRSTKFFQRATRLWKSHQCATKRTLLNTL